MLAPKRAIATERLALEPLRKAHADVLWEGLSDPRLYTYHAGKPKSVEGLHKRFSRLEAGPWPHENQLWFNWAIRLKGREYVGWIQATVEDKEALLGYDIFAQHWRKGYAKEACAAVMVLLAREYEVATFSAVVDSENTASQALLESLGFVKLSIGPSEDMPGRVDHHYRLG